MDVASEMQGSLVDEVFRAHQPHLLSKWKQTLLLHRNELLQQPRQEPESGAPVRPMTSRIGQISGLERPIRLPCALRRRLRGLASEDQGA